MTKSLIVMIVDDDASARLTAAAALDAPERELHECEDGPTLLTALEVISPDLILLDVEMPIMNGIETCRTLRAAGHDSEHVIFISAHDDLETRLAAYDAGGNDFVVKPYRLDELEHKVRIANKHSSRHRELGAQALHAQKTAFTAMSSMAEMGCVMDFLRNCLACDTPSTLAGRLFDATRHFDLPCLAKLRSNGEWQYFSSTGECSPIEYDIIEHASSLERIFQFRDRMAINYPAIRLFVSGLPVNDPERVGRLRDHLAVIAEGAQARLQALDTAHTKALQNRGITLALSDLVHALEDIKRNQAAYRLRAEEINGSYLHDLTNAFGHLGLTDDQEDGLAKMAEHTYTELAALRDMDGDISDRLGKVVGRLRKLTSDYAARETKN